MEGSHQKGSNWYRCLFVYRRSVAAADVAGHPRVVGIKAQAIVGELFDFLGQRIFGPERLRLLRDELARSVATVWSHHQAELERLEQELDDVERALYRQALRLEEHDDPEHPVVAVAKRRIEELSGRRASVTEAIKTLELSRPAGARPEEIEAMLAAVPDLRSALPEYGPEDLAELFATSAPSCASSRWASSSTPTSATSSSACSRPTAPSAARSSASDREGGSSQKTCRT